MVHQKDQTRARYRGILRRELLPVFGPRSLAKIRPHHVRSRVAGQTAGPLSASSVRQSIAVLRQVPQGRADVEHRESCRLAPTLAMWQYICMPAPAARQPMSILMDTWLISNLANGLLDDALQLSGMSGDDFALYSLLSAFGPASPTQIARWTGMRPTTVSAALKRLASRGHSTQHRAAADRRSYYVGLSETGRAAHTATAEVFWDETRKLAELLGDREPELRHHLQSLDASLREAAALDPRPYRLSSDVSSQPWHLSYQGQPLTPEQEQLVRQYIDFLRTPSH